jgi:aldehyde oxidoreductase
MEASMQLRKMWFNINGADRMIVCDPEKDTLADVLRRIGLTGTKVSCRKGICGACSVIVKGKLTKSCSQKMGKLDEFSKIITIEGIGTPMHPHPLQQAFVRCGAVQCGFCTPGFIVAAYALLQENPNPSREAVRAWFQKNRNACRCTGYKQIVDAVMLAARIMRGEGSLDDLAYQGAGRYYNSRVPRPSALAKACGVLDYGEDVSLKMPEETLHLAIVQPRVAHHAKILRIDTSEAEKMPGVVKVVTSKDVQGNNRINAFAMHKRAKITAPTRPIFSDDIIYRYGDVIACVAADTREHAREAAKFVKLEYEKLPEYTSYLDAVTPDARQIHPEGPNIYVLQPAVKGDEADRIIEESPYSVEGRFRTPREPHLSIEGDIVQAYWDEDGMMTIHCKSQSIYSNLFTMAKGIGVDMEKLRIVLNAVGGSFGWSTEPASFAIAAVCCMATGKPVSLVMSYEEFMHFSGKRTSSYINGRLSCDKDGIITALEYDMGVDHGAYLEGEAITGKLACFGNPYKIPNLRGLIRMGVTNHNFGTAYRGYGFPQVTTAMESLMDMLAEKAGMDPFEFRFKNLLREGDLTVSLRPLDYYSYEAMYNAARPYYLECKERAARESTPELKRGVGLATMYFNPLAGPFDAAEVALELMSDNRIRLNDTWQDVGQGGDVGSMTLALEALSPLKLTPDRIQLDLNDSKYCPDTGISASSRSHYMGGNAIIDAAKKLMDAMRKNDGSYRTYDEMIAENIPVRHVGHYDIAGLNLGGKNPDTGEGESSPTGMYGFCIAEVAVDTKTGKTRTVSIKMWADAGVIGNYDAAEGQAYGGLSHDIGYALSEDYDDVEKHDNILRAGIPYIEDVPDNMEIVWIESNPREGGPYGSSGLSELFQSGEHMAILNGIYAATGVRIYELPAYPEKVKAGLEKIARGEKTEPPAKYFLGSDLYDELEEIAANPLNDAPFVFPG